MDQRIPLLAEQLLLIERELRLQNWWGEQPPTAEALLYGLIQLQNKIRRTSTIAR